MKRRKIAGQRKTRTREHVITDLGVNFVERFILLHGFSCERVQRDYGVDLVMFTYNEHGEIENGQILLQIKATDHLRMLRDGSISFALARADLKYWLHETDPVILIVYDGQADSAYWLYVQAYFEAKRPLDLFTGSGKMSVRIPTVNRVNRRSIDRFATFRDQVEQQIDGRIRHYV